MSRQRPIVDAIPCAWCTNPFERTSEQRRVGVRHCCRRCAAFGRAVTIPDAHYVRMAKLSHRSRVAGRLRVLGATVAGLSTVQAYLKGYRTGYSAGKARRRSVMIGNVA